MAGTHDEWIAAACAEQGLPDHYAHHVVDHLQALANQVIELHRQKAGSVVIGLNGGQGSGKSTLALFLVEWLKRECGVSAASLSLDDLYIGKSRRQELARTVHSLFVTRGVPGTHDVPLGIKLLDGLLGADEPGTVAMPKFDKAADDLRDEFDWPAIKTPVDVVLFEGWCVGARPQADSELAFPLNALEKEDDRDGRWRAAVNDHLKTDYAELFGRLDMLVMLRIPSFEKAIEWRCLQESKLDHQLSEQQLQRFMMHFERLTRHMLETVPSYADAVIDINDRHEMTRVAWAPDL